MAKEGALRGRYLFSSVVEITENTPENARR
jgi:hypothetical protein